MPFDLVAAARREMIERGFEPDMPEAAARQARELAPGRPDGLEDLTALLWSSIDNDESRDLDQVEWAERVAGGIRVLVGIADVDVLVARNTPIDAHASRETTTVYTGVRVFPMLPERLSTDLTSLGENEPRAAIVIEMVVNAEGDIASSAVRRALVRNRAQLTYSATGPWLEGTASPPAKVAAAAELEAQLKLQDEAAHALREARHRKGALSFDRQETQAVVENGHVKSIEARRANRASRLIEDFMIGANEVMAQTLRAAGVTSIRRVVKAPERWQRIRDLAERYGSKLPPEPDAQALNEFLVERKRSDAGHYADVSLAVLKLMGPGVYVASRAGGSRRATSVWRRWITRIRRRRTGGSPTWSRSACSRHFWPNVRRRIPTTSWMKSRATAHSWKTPPAKCSATWPSGSRPSPCRIAWASSLRRW